MCKGFSWFPCANQNQKTMRIAMFLICSYNQSGKISQTTQTEQISQSQIHQLKFKTLNAIDLAWSSYTKSCIHVFLVVNQPFLWSQATILHHTFRLLKAKHTTESAWPLTQSSSGNPVDIDSHPQKNEKKNKSPLNRCLWYALYLFQACS